MSVIYQDNRHLLDQVGEIAKLAGREIMDVYRRPNLSIEYKEDGSPLTVADLRSHAIIETSLQQLTPYIPLLSEESSAETHRERIEWATLWMVDPLDGTKGFVKRNGEFTVNIALIHNKRPILGVVHTPVESLMHYAAEGIGAFCCKGDDPPYAIQTRELPDQGLVVVSSRSRQQRHLDRFLKQVRRRFTSVETLFMGSSLKICRVAEGIADVYPRIGSTSEWDTAAAQCVLEAAGGKMFDVAGNSLEYNKLDILNPKFFASGSSEVDWAEFL